MSVWNGYLTAQLRRLGSSMIRWQLSITRRPVLVPPCMAIPLAVRALIFTSTPCQ
jgi:hypothetical protein